MAKEKLTPIPRRSRKRAPAAPAPTAALQSAPPDLSHIAEQLRPLAVPIGDLKFDPANARTHDEKNLDAITGSLAVYGQRKPVVVNKRTGFVEAGNGTLQAALALGWTHLAAVHVDDDHARAIGFSLADNRSGDLAGWDEKALDKLLREVSTGNDERLDAMLAALASDVGLVTGEQSKSRGRTEVEATVVCPECGHRFTRP